MSPVSSKFKASVIAQLKAQAENFNLTEIQTGDDEVIALAHIAGFYDAGTSPLLSVRRVQDRLVIAIRNLAYLGKPSSVTNLTVDFIWGELAHMVIAKEGCSRKARLTHVLALDAFTSRQKTTEDFCAMVVLAMNKHYLSSRSMVDFADGEVSVDSVQDCDFDTEPPCLFDRLDEVAGHSHMLSRILGVVRQEVSEDPVSAAECRRSITKLEQLLNQRFDEACSSGSATSEGQGQDVSAVTTPSEEDEEITI